MADFGKIEMQFGSQIVSINGSVDFENLTGGETTPEANADGTVHATFENRVPMANIENISACTIPLGELAKLISNCDQDQNYTPIIFTMSGSCSLNFTTVNFTDGRFAGSLNFSGNDGKASGISVYGSNVLIDGINPRG